MTYVLDACKTYYDQLKTKTPEEVQEFCELVALSPIKMIDTIGAAVTRESSRSSLKFGAGYLFLPLKT